MYLCLFTVVQTGLQYWSTQQSFRKWNVQHACREPNGRAPLSGKATLACCWTTRKGQCRTPAPTTRVSAAQARLRAARYLLHFFGSRTEALSDPVPRVGSERGLRSAGFVAPAAWGTRVPPSPAAGRECRAASGPSARRVPGGSARFCRQLLPRLSAPCSSIQRAAAVRTASEWRRSHGRGAERRWGDALRPAPPRPVPSRARLPQPRTAERGRPAPCGGSASPGAGREPAPCSRPPPSLPPPRLPPPALPPPRLSPPLSAPQPPPGRPALPDLCGRRGWQRGCGPWPCGCWRWPSPWWRGASPTRPWRKPPNPRATAAGSCEPKAPGGKGTMNLAWGWRAIRNSTNLETVIAVSWPSPPSDGRGNGLDKCPQNYGESLPVSSPSLPACDCVGSGRGTCSHALLNWGCFDDKWERVAFHGIAFTPENRLDIRRNFLSFMNSLCRLCSSAALQVDGIQNELFPRLPASVGFLSSPANAAQRGEASPSSRKERELGAGCSCPEMWMLI